MKAAAAAETRIAELEAQLEMAVAALREIERWPAPIDGGKVRAVASAALGKLVKP